MTRPGAVHNVGSGSLPGIRVEDGVDVGNAIVVDLGESEAISLG
jgi:hypothetical protein